MNILKELKAKSVDSLAELYKLKVSKKDGLVILNYDQIESKKNHPSVDECRGLVVTEGGELVARAFKRFYNLEEKLTQDFDWSEFTTNDKVDGSLILIYFYNGEWRINTRGSFGEGIIHTECPYTWSSLVKECVNVNLLDKRYTYVAELCSRYNKVVVDYPTPIVYILSAFKGEEELTLEETFALTEGAGFEKPVCYKLRSVQEVSEWISAASNKYGGAYEGVVLRDKKNCRIKVKNPLYVALHHLKGNGNLFLYRNIVPFVFAGESEEVLGYFPELKEKVGIVEAFIAEVKDKLDRFWFCHHDEASQKKFALEAISFLGPYSSLAFSARKLAAHPHTFITADFVIKHLESR